MIDRAERLALQLVARRDRAALEALRDAALAGLAALDAFEGRAPSPAAAPSTTELTPRQRAGRAAAEARWHPERIASAPHPRRMRSASPTHAVGIGSASAAHGGGDKGGETDLPISLEDSPNNPEKYPARDACAADAETDAKRTQVRVDLFVDGTLDAWAEGIRAVTGKPVTGLRHSQRNELIEVVLTHALDEPDRRAWLREKVERFARAYDPKYGGWTPSTFARWLNSGEPESKAPARAARAIVQRENVPETVTESLLEVANA